MHVGKGKGGGEEERRVIRPPRKINKYTYRLTNISLLIYFLPRPQNYLPEITSLKLSHLLP